MTQKKLKKPIILAIETSTPKLSLALYKNNKIFETILEKDLPDYAENLVPQLDKLLKQSKTTLKDISLIGCNIGPGSFTGLRVGLCFARTLAEELKIKLFISNSFYMCLTNFLLDNCRSFDKKINIIVLLAAVKSEVYYKKFEINKNSITSFSKNLCIKKSEIISLIKNVNNIYIIGNDIDFLLTENLNIDKKNLIKTFPKAVDLIKIFLHTNLHTTISTKKISPLYIRHTYY